MSIVIRKGTVADTENYIRLLRESKAAMANPEWFCVDPPEEIREMMQSGMMRLWVAMDADRLAGAFDYLVPGLESYNYGYDLGFDEAMLLRVVQMDSAAVHPDYRGQGLQKRLMESAEEEIRRESGRILLCTVHPDNVYSLRNVLNQGYVIQKELPKYGSVRCFLRKDLP